MKTIEAVRTHIREKIAEAIFAKYQEKVLGGEIVLQNPPKETLGEFAFGCFSLSKTLKKNPAEIAKELQDYFAENADEVISRAEAIGPYLNVYLNRAQYADTVLKEIAKLGEKFGSHKIGKGKRVMIEFSSPNTNKPQHLGHVRNNMLGFSLSLLAEKIGYEAVRVTLVNDRGIHIMQSMLAYKKWGELEGDTPDKSDLKPDHFVGKYYVEYNKRNKKLVEKALEKDENFSKLAGKEQEDYKREVARNTPLAKEAQEMLREWEAGDPTVRKLWEKMNGWALEGIRKTYVDLGVYFDDEIFESDIYTQGKDIVFEGEKSGVFTKDEKNRIVANLEDVNLPNKVLLRSDGTSLYVTQDLYLAIYKFENWYIDISVYVVASEQDLHFKQLFAILKKLGHSFANEDQLIHRSYGWIFLPEGRMKSREGKVVDADDVIAEIIDLAKKKAEASETSTKSNLETTSRQVGLGALKFFLLSHSAKSTITYDPKKTLAFEGFTGPFVQYAHARAKSVLRKAGEKLTTKIDCTTLQDDESFFLVKKLSDYPKKTLEAAIMYDPSIMALYLFELAQTFNTFYHAKPILKAEAEEKQARLLLASATADVLKNGLELLGIEAPEEM